MGEVETRIKAQFPGLYVTFLSILIGLVIEDLGSAVREMEGLWPLDAAAVRTWIQVLTTFEALLVAWVAYSHVAIGRRAVPRLQDSVVVFLIPGYLYLMNSLVGTPDAHVWFYAVVGYVCVSWVASYGVVYQASREPGLDGMASLNRLGGPLLINYLSIPFFLAAGLASQNGLLSEGVETSIMGLGPPALIAWIFWFVRDWRRYVAEDGG